MSSLVSEFFDKDSKSEKTFFFEWGEVGGGGGEGALKPKQYVRLSNEVKCKKATIHTM